MADGLTSNPYRAPETFVGDVHLGEAAPPRPRAVFFTLVIGWVWVAFFAALVARFTFDLVRYWAAASQSGSFYIRIGWRAAILAILIIMVSTLHKRTRIGRWLGALFILHILSLSLISMVAASSRNGNIYMKLGAVIGAILVCAPMVYWFYAFTLSRKARTWFNWAPAPDAPR